MKWNKFGNNNDLWIEFVALEYYKKDDYRKVLPKNIVDALIG